MPIPKLFPVLLAAVALNAGLVLWSVVERHAFAKPTAAQETIDEDSEPQPSSTQADGKPAEETAATADLTSSPHKVLESLPPPSGLPHVPSLEAPQNDPGFQSFLDLAAEQFPDLMSLPDSPAVKPHRQSPEYFAALEGRLETVQQLGAAATSLSREAKRLAENGEAGRAAKFLQMITQLREMSAALLVQEL